MLQAGLVVSPRVVAATGLATVILGVVGNRCMGSVPTLQQRSTITRTRCSEIEQGQMCS